MDATINIPFPCRLNVELDGNRSFHYVVGDGMPSCYASTAAAAKKKLRALLAVHVTDCLRAAENTERAVIGCVDGTVLIVEFRYDSWGYAIAGAGRKCLSACGCGNDGFDVVCGHALRHAADSYGGVSWQNGVPGAILAGAKKVPSSETSS